MEVTAGRKLYESLIEMNHVFQRGSGSGVLKDSFLGGDFAAVIVKFTGIVADCRDEILRSRFKDEGHSETLISRLNGIQSITLNALSTRGKAGTTGPLVEETTLAYALGIAEQIENGTSVSVVTTTREEMVSLTEALVAEVKGWDMGEYAKKTLLIQLNNIIRIIQTADTYSDSELRFRVKAIIADFATEFVSMDKNYQSKLEILVRWGRATVFAGTTFLGLTSDAAAVAGLLSPPPKLLTGN